MDSQLKLQRMQLQFSYKKIGLGLALISLGLVIASKLFIQAEYISMFAKYGMLIGMLIYSISKEKIEDELIIKLRMQSYAFSFITAAITLLAQPIINYIADVVKDDNKPNFESYEYFEILLILLSLQIFFFEIQKRKHK
jgi:hypothetical protein